MRCSPELRPPFRILAAVVAVSALAGGLRSLLSVAHYEGWDAVFMAAVGIVGFSLAGPMARMAWLGQAVPPFGTQQRSEREQAKSASEERGSNRRRQLDNQAGGRTTTRTCSIRFRRRSLLLL